MNQYSEDTGLSNNPNGYTFTEGQMVTEFYDGAKALAEDEVSELVKSSYGYHIIKRVKLDDSQLDNFKSDIVSAISGSMDELLKQWIDEAQVETTDLYSSITYENVYDYLPQDVQTLITRPGEESEQSDAQQSDADPVCRPSSPLSKVNHEKSLYTAYRLFFVHKKFTKCFRIYAE